MDYRYKVDYPLIAKRIKTARKLAGLTQEQLAEKNRHIDQCSGQAGKQPDDNQPPDIGEHCQRSAYGYQRFAV